MTNRIMPRAFFVQTQVHERVICGLWADYVQDHLGWPALLENWAHHTVNHTCSHETLSPHVLPGVRAALTTQLAAFMDRAISKYERKRVDAGARTFLLPLLLSGIWFQAASGEKKQFAHFSRQMLMLLM
jgi:hypothetical protein